MVKKRKRIVRSFRSNQRLEIMGQSKLRKKQKNFVYRIKLGFLGWALGSLNYCVNFGNVEVDQEIERKKTKEIERWR